MPESVVSVVAVLLAATFAWAGAAKLVLHPRWRAALAGYGLGRSLETVAAPGVPIAEFAVAVLLVAGPPRVGAALALALLAGFSWVVARAGAGGRTSLPCGCFGSSATRDYRTMLVRNAVLAVATATVLVAGRDVAVLEELPVPSADDALPAALVAAALAFGAWMVREVTQGFGRGSQR